MYVEIVPNRNSRPAILLREGWREGKKVCKRTVANLSDWPARKVELLRRVQRETEIGILLITHDFGVVSEMADTVYVMRDGRIVEHAAVADLFSRPQHPYTKELLASVPRVGSWLAT